MSKETLRATGNSASGRIFFVDNLRIILVILVVLHHFAAIYAATAIFYYVEPTPEILPPVILTIFQVLNQAFFMGLYFLLSGYFTPHSFDRKGPGNFLRDRMLRFGIPLLIYIFVLNPIASIGVYEIPSKLTGITTALSWQQYPSLIGFGPLWFLIMLLVFDSGYALWRSVLKSREPDSIKAKPLPIGAVFTFILILAMASYLLRVVIPYGQYVLGFPSLAYFPQYISFFVIGIAAYRYNWLRSIPDKLGTVGFILASVATLALVAIVILYLTAASDISVFFGRGTWQSGIFALWDSIFSVGICLGLITLFRKRYNQQDKLGHFLSQNAFTVYIIHAPLITWFAIALKGIHIEQFLKFALAAVIGILLCFLVAYLIRKIPNANRIL